MVRAHWNGAVIAESDDTVVVEGNHYFPADSVNHQYLVSSPTTTVCPWKGRASYYSLQVDGKVNRDAAWYYPTASAAARSIESRIAFWRGVKIDDEGKRSRRRSFFDRFRRASASTAGGRAESAGTEAPSVAATHQAEAAVADPDDASFFGVVDGHVTIADFWAPWCGPCKALHPLFDAQAIGHSGDLVHFVRVNVDDSPGVAAAFSIMSIPTIIVFDAHGREIDREIGVPSRRRFDQLVGSAEALASVSSGRGAA